jgi:hypothetical protein
MLSSSENSSLASGGLFPSLIVNVFSFPYCLSGIKRERGEKPRGREGGEILSSSKGGIAIIKAIFPLNSQGLRQSYFL